MKLLEKIATFPSQARKTLQTQFGIESAEAFYAHATRNSEGIKEALKVTNSELKELVATVEAHLPTDVIEELKKPVKKRPRGALSD